MFIRRYFKNPILLPMSLRWVRPEGRKHLKMTTAGCQSIWMNYSCKQTDIAVLVYSAEFQPYLYRDAKC